jgi:hypothetical protein
LAGRSLRDSDGNEVPLTRAEFALLVVLARHPGRAARELTPISFEQIYSGRGADYGQEAQELVDLLVRAGIGVGKYEYRGLQHGYPPRFWRKAAVAANELSNWLKLNPMAPSEDRLAHAQRVVNMNRLVHRSLRSVWEGDT